MERGGENWEGRLEQSTCAGQEVKQQKELTTPGRASYWEKTRGKESWSEGKLWGSSSSKIERRRPTGKG